MSFYHRLVSPGHGFQKFSGNSYRASIRQSASIGVSREEPVTRSQAPEDDSHPESGNDNI